MTTAKHTSGPWAVSKLASPDYAPQFGIYSEGTGAYDLARVIGDNAEANAYLIAAAPELLKALEIMIRATRDPDHLDPLVMFASIEKAREAVRIAKGE